VTAHDHADRNHTEGRPGAKRWLKTGLKLTLSIGLLVFLVTRLDLSGAISRCMDAHLGFLLLALALLSTQGLVSSIKWQVILKADDCVVPLLHLWKTYLIGMFLSLLLPTSFGGDIYRVYAVRRGAAGLVKGTSSVLFDRISGLVALATLAMIGSLCLRDTRFIWPVLAGYVVFVTVGLLLSTDRALRWMQRWQHGRLRFGVKVVESFNRYRKDRRRLVIVALISLLFQTSVVVINKLYSEALDIDVSFLQLLMIVPLVYLTEALPISINGLGVREGAFVFFFLAIGQTAEAGLALALFVVVFRYSTGLIGGGLLAWDWLRGWPTPFEDEGEGDDASKTSNVQ